MALITLIAGLPTARWPCGRPSSTCRCSHAHVLILSVDIRPIPHVPPSERLAPIEGHIDRDASYFLSTIELIPGRDPGLWRWQKRLFLATAHIAGDPVEFFGLPRDRTVVMGSRIEV